MSPEDELLRVLRSHQCDGFYVGKNIPANKIMNARANYPVSRDYKILGLIDATVFGSAKLGLVVTDRGLIWKNDWTSPSSQSTLDWGELLEAKPSITTSLYDLKFGRDIEFNMSGSSMKKAAAVVLMQDIVELLEVWKYEIEAEERKDAQPQIVYQEEVEELDCSSEEQGLYEEVLISALALMTIADGEIEESEVETVLDFINEEDSIKDTQQALASYEEYLDQLTVSYDKSKAIFKLKSEKIIVGMKKLQNEDLISRLEIMLEGMLDVAGGAENTPTVEMMGRILKALDA